MAQTTSITLTPTQKQILSVISRQGSISLGSLAEKLSAYKPQELSFDNWKQEIDMQCRLFSLRGVLTAKRSQKNTVRYQAGKRLAQWKPRSVRRKKSMSPLRYKRIPALLLASSLMLNGCSMMPSWMKPSDSLNTAPATARKLPVYNADGWLPPERMEQFQIPGKGMVYRYCTTDCPEPTPKLQRVYSSVSSKGEKPRRATFVATYSTDPIPVMAQTPDEIALIQENAHMESVIAEAETYLRENPIPKAAQKAAASPVAPPAPSDDKFSAVSIKLADALNKAVNGQAQPKAAAKQKDDSGVTEAKAKKAKQGKGDTSEISESATQPAQQDASKITFVGKTDVLSEAGKQAVRELAIQSEKYDLIKLRGCAAFAKEDDEALLRISLGRALAVRSELVSAGVPREKLLILRPNLDLAKQSNGNSILVTLFPTKNQNNVAANLGTKKEMSDGGKS